MKADYLGRKGLHNPSGSIYLHSIAALDINIRVAYLRAATLTVPTKGRCIDWE